MATIDTYMKNIVTLGLVLIMGTLGTTAFAEESSTGGSGLGTQKAIHDSRETIRNEKLDRKEDVKNARQDFKAEREDIKNSSSTKGEKAGAIIDARKDLREDVKDRNQEAREKIKDERQNIKDQREERRREIAKKHFEQVVARMTAHIERLEKLATRIETRIGKIEATGRDMTKAKSNLAIGKTKIDSAKSALVSFKTSGLSTVDSLASTTPNNLLKSLKDSADVVEKLIREAHQALVDAVNSIIPGKPGTATTTSTGSNE